MFDVHSNFGYSTVTAAPSPGTSGTTLVLGTTTFADFPDPGTIGYNVPVWPAGTIPLSTNSEIVRVVAKGTNGTLNIVREQESTSARDITVGDQCGVAITKKVITDIEGTIPTQATGAEINTGTATTKFVSPLAIADSWIESGWAPAKETWTYASATTFTVASDVTGKYQKGDKIKFTQATDGVKYMYIIGVSESGGTTTITVTGGSDYDLDNEAITANYYSKIASPQGFPDWFNYTPSLSGNGTITWTVSTICLAKFRIIGQSCHINVRIDGTTGGSASNAVKFTLPVTLNSSVSTAFMVLGCGVFYDSGDSMCVALRDNTSTSTVFVEKYNTTNFGLGITKVASIIGEYQI